MTCFANAELSDIMTEQLWLHLLKQKLSGHADAVLHELVVSTPG